MKLRLTTTIICLFFTVNALGQEKAPANKLSAKLSPEAAASEARSRKLWEDFQKRDKAALSATLAEGFRALEEGANGFADANGYLSTLDDFELKSYDLSDYKVVRLGSDAFLVNYHARYEGISNWRNHPGECWVFRGLGSTRHPMENSVSAGNLLEMSSATKTRRRAHQR
jgi:hypothetical protein